MNSWLDKNRDIGILLLRIFIGVRLIFGVQDNVFDWTHMIKFSDFLDQYNFPFPLLCAIVSVYVQLIAGIMFILGLQIRVAALLMIINFLVALVMVHRDASFEGMTAPLAILFSCVVFLFNGAGKYSLDRETSQVKRHYFKEHYTDNV